MRHFRIWGGAKPSVDNKNFIIAWGENRTNPTYWVISPQSSITQLSSPVCTSASIVGSSDYSHGTYKFTIKNNNIEDVIFEGIIGITPEGDPTIYKSVSFFIPGGGSYEYSYISEEIIIGGDSISGIVSGGTTSYLHHTHTGASSKSTGTAITGVTGGTTTATLNYMKFAAGTTPKASASFTGSAATGSVTLTPTGSVSLTTSTATSTGAVKYLEAASASGTSTVLTGQ